MQALLERRLVFVTGKGGVGKSAVAAALARVAASRGKRVLVCEMDDKGSLATYLGYEQLAFEPVTVAPNLSAMAMNTEDSLREYIKLYLRVPIIGSLAPLARIFDFVANAAPAVKEILAIGKLCYEVREKNYDLIIADSEASGHFVAQVSAPDALAALVRIGIIADQTKWMSDLLHDHAVSAVLAVVTPEEMPVVETLELRERMAKATPVNFAGVVVNRMPVEPAREAVAAVASSATVSDETRAVVQWLAARRAAAEGHAKVLADAFELANVETLSEAPAESGDAVAGNRVPTAIVAHLVGEIDRVLGEHA
ncbi:MAG: anion-transporting ATPase [Actinobacteria bacterium]|nr:anion-transporting ATPase [Actinomycetota bacterium]NDG76705.1 anion-transporting ATPase [Acidimicrobiia bacterium]